MRYLDIDTILSEEERIPCVFLSDAKKLSFLDPSIGTVYGSTGTEGDNDLPKDSRVELPLWLGSALSERRMVKIEIPKHFGSKMRDELMADAASVNLREFSYYFFEVGLRICQITKDNDLQRSLRIAFCGDRFRALLVRGFNSGSNKDDAEFVQTLTASEYKICQYGMKTAEEIYRWKTREAFVLQKSSLLRRKASSENENDRKRQAI